MPTFSEILQASELAIPKDGVYPWPEGSIELMGSDGVLVNGATLGTLGIKHVKPSQHEFLKDQHRTYSGFKIGDTPVVLSKVGTQPHSAGVANNQMIKLMTPGNILVYRNEDGTVQVGSTTIGDPLASPVLSTRKRGISFVIVHICGAGGGGGGGGSVNKGKGGGSGSILVALIDIRLFSQTHPLVFEIGAGGSGGEGKFNGGNGEDGGQTYVRSTLETGGATIPPGTGGEGGAGSSGVGGGFPIVSGNHSFINVLTSDAGNPGSDQTGGFLKNLTYTDPNPGEITVKTSMSFLGDVGNGGDGGKVYTDGTRGKPGSVCIYY